MYMYSMDIKVRILYSHFTCLVFSHIIVTQLQSENVYRVTFRLEGVKLLFKESCVMTTIFHIMDK